MIPSKEGRIFDIDCRLQTMDDWRLNFGNSIFIFWPFLVLPEALRHAQGRRKSSASIIRRTCAFGTKIALDSLRPILVTRCGIGSYNFFRNLDFCFWLVSFLAEKKLEFSRCGWEMLIIIFSNNSQKKTAKKALFLATWVSRRAGIYLTRWNSVMYSL